MPTHTRPRSLLRHMRFHAALARAIGGAAVRRIRKGASHPDWPLSYELAMAFLRVAGGEYYDFGVALARKRVSPITPSVAREVQLTQQRVAGIDVDVHAPRSGDDQVPTVLFLHGGGYVTCSPRSHRDVVARLSAVANARCVVPDYRLAPAHPFPAALEDALACYRELLRAGVPARSLFVAGDSAGGGLAVALTLALRDFGEPLPCGLVLLSPWLDLSVTEQALARQGRADYLGAKSLSANALLYAGSTSLAHPAISPLYADLHGLPPVLLETGQWEIMREQNERFADQARDAGVSVEHRVVPGMLHAFPCFAAILPQGVEALARAGSFVRTLHEAHPTSLS